MSTFSFIICEFESYLETFSPEPLLRNSTLIIGFVKGCLKLFIHRRGHTWLCTLILSSALNMLIMLGALATIYYHKEKRRESEKSLFFTILNHWQKQDTHSFLLLRNKQYSCLFHWWLNRQVNDFCRLKNYVIH